MGKKRSKGLRKEHGSNRQKESGSKEKTTNNCFTFKDVSESPCDERELPSRSNLPESSSSGVETEFESRLSALLSNEKAGDNTYGNMRNQSSAETVLMSNLTSPINLETLQNIRRISYQYLLSDLTKLISTPPLHSN